MRKLFTLVLCLLALNSVFGQLAGIKTIPGDYASIAAAVTDLNTQGVGVGGVTFDIAAAYTETAPTGGIVITATGAPTDPIIFQKSGSGANPLITAPLLAAATTYDGVVKIAGGDYITFDAIDIIENVGNITLLTDWGYALVKANALAPFNGCQYVTIKNCNISLNKANTTAIGIYSGNHIATSTTALTITATTDATNNCKFFNNAISNVYGGISIAGFAATTPYTLYDMNNEIGVGGANTITNLGGAATSVRAIYAIYQNGLKIANNSVNSSLNGLTTMGYGIFVSTGTSSNLDIYNNTIAFTFSAGAYTSTISGINSAMGGTGVGNIVNIYNNTVSNCNLSTATTGSLVGILNSASAATLNVYGNIVTGNTLAGTGTFTGIDGGGLVNLNMYSNNVYNNSKTGAGAIYCMRAGTALVSFHDNNIYTNTITTTGVVTTAGIVYGYYDISSPTLETIYNNNIYGLSVSGTTTSVVSIVRGLYTNTIAAAVKNIYSNQIYNLSISTVGGGTVEGMYQASGATNNFFKNKIYNLSASAASGVVNGMNISSGTTNNIYNNLISDLRAPAATGLIAVNGINIAGGTTANLYYNTIYINATSSSITTFGTSGIYASTTPTVNLRNNIVVNNSTSVGATAFTVAYRRSSANLTSYAATSNNNDFYAGSPSASNLIFFDGITPYQTIAAYKTVVAPRDAASISENPNWVSTTGTDLAFLHINTTIPTQLESGGAPITSISEDYDGNIRDASTPDIGADEFTGILLDIVPPTISYSPLLNTSSTSSRVLTATISDISGVPQSGIGLPMLYWTINNGSYTGVQGVWVSGNTYTFTFGSGVILSDVVSYYIVAQDNAATPNIAVSPSSGVSGYTSNPPTVATPPTNPSTYIVGSICGTINVGAAEPAPYNTITSAIADFNSKEMTCAVTFLLTDAAYPTETFPIVINANGGASAVNTLTIKPAIGVTPFITGASTASMIKILNNYTSIDGSNAVGGTTRDLTITNTSLTTPSVIVINSTGIAPIVGGTIKNCILINGANTSTAVIISDATGTAGYFNNITIQNNSIQKAYNGIFALAVGATGNGSGMLITGNDLNTSGANAIRLVGIYAQGVDGVTITNNQIGNIADANAESPKGIWLATGTNSATISGNTISNISLTNTGAYAITGIYVSAGATATSINVTNNTISNLSNSGTALAFAGILTFSPNTNITNNTVTGLTQLGSAGFWGIVQSGAINSNCSGNTVSGLTTASYGTASGINIQGASIGVSISKNKVYNIKNTNSGGYTAYGILLSSTSSASNITLDNNFVWDVAAYGDVSSWSQYNGYGIGISSGGGYNIYFNSVQMATDQTQNGNPACFIIASSVTNPIDVRNNIFANFQTIGTNRYAIISNVANTVYSDINYNDYYTSGPNLGFLGANVLDLAAWKTATGKDVNSVSGNPNFISATDLHIQTTALTPVSNSGTQIASITTDIDGDLRNNPPDIGADEFFLVVCNGAVGGTAIGSATICAGLSNPITASGYSTGLGSTYQWQYSNDNFVSDSNDFVGQTNPAALTTGPVFDTTYYRLKVTCVAGLATDYSTVVTITTKPIPTISASSNSPICAGSTLNLIGTNDIGTSFSWTGPNGFSTTDQSPSIVSATTAASGTYLLTASFDGCTSIVSTTSVAVNPLPTNVTASASSNEVCTSSTFSLFSTSTSNAFSTNTYIYPAAEGGFESGLTFGDNGWTVVNSAVNYWVLDNLAPAYDGLRGAHISQTGIAYDYSHVTSTSHFYRDVVIPAGSQNISLSFNWKGEGENYGISSGFDRLLVYTAPTTVIPVANTPVSNSTTLTGATLVWTQITYQSNYTLATVTLPNSLAGTTVRLIFTWQNDYIDGTNPPVAIDNISLTSSVMTNSFYSWASNPVGFTSADQNPIGVTQLVNTEYIVTAQNAFGCSASANTTVTLVTGAEIITQPLPNSKCAGQTATFTVAAIGPSLTYQWYKNGLMIPILGNPSAGTATLSLPNVSATDIANYSVVVTANCGAPVTSNDVALVVKPVPIASASFDSPMCEGGDLYLNGSTDIGTEFSWTGPNGFSSTDLSPIIVSTTTAASGDYLFTASLNGCTSLVSTANLTVNPLPSSVTASSSSSEVCIGSPFSLFSSSSSNFYNTASYITPTAEGGFESGLTFGDNGWTVVNSAVNFWVLDNLAPAYDGLKGAHISQTGIAYDYAHESGTSATSHFYKDIVIPTGSQNISLSFYWKGFGESSIWDRLLVYTAPTSVLPVANVPASSSTALAGATLIWTQTTFTQSTYTLATVTLPNSLAGTSVRLIFTWQNDGSGGTNPPIAIDNISLSSSILTPDTYSWTSLPSGFASSDQNPIGVLQSVSTEYIVTAQNDYGCIATANTTVTNVSGAQITTQPLPDTKCTGQTATFTVVAIGPSLTYQWKKNGIDIPIISNPSASTATLSLPNVSATDVTNYSVVVTATCGVPVTSNSAALIVNPIPTATASSSSPVCTGNTLNLLGATDIGTIFGWTGPNGFTSTSQNPSISSTTTSAAGTYFFTATALGCTSIVSTTDVVINQTPSSVIVTPSNPAICDGAIQQLAASGGTPLPSIMAENFNGSALGWVITNAGSSPIVSNFYYQLTPYTSSAFTNFSTSDGGKFVYSNADAGGSGSTTDTKLTSPVFSTVGYSAASLTFEHLYKSWSSDITVALEISTDGGATWSVLRDYKGTNIGVITSPQVTANENIDLSAYLNQANLKIRYNYVTAWGYYWLIDNVSIAGTPIPVAITWNPTTDLFSNSGASNPYVSGTPAATVYAKPTLTTTYTATATTSAGCSNSGSSVITVFPTPPAPTIGTITQPSCSIATGNIVVTAPTGIGMTYSIDGSDYTNTTGVFNTVAGSYTVTAKSSDGCVSAGTNVTIDAQPPTPTTPNATLVQPNCTVPTGTITVISPIGLGMTYSIDGSTYTNSTGIFTSLVPNTYTVTAKNSFGCISLGASFTINPQPPTPTTPTTTLIQPNCLVGNGTITVTSPTGLGMTYSIDGYYYTNSTGVFPLINPGIYTVTAKNSDGCISLGTSVTINPQPPTPNTPTLSLVQPSCLVSTGSISVTSPLGIGLTYSIDGTNYTNTTGIFTSVNTGIYTVTAQNSVGCVSPGATAIINTQPPTPSTPTVTLVQPSCTIAVGTITVTSPTDIGMTYSIDGSTYTNFTGIFSSLVPNTYTVTAKNSLGCISLGTTITINAQPPTPIAPTLSLIQPTCSTLGTITVTSPTGLGMTYSIDGYTYINSSGIFTSIPTGLYMVTAMNSFGCISTGTNATINNQPPTPNVSDQTVSILTGDNFNVTPTGVPIGTTYTWTTPSYSGSVSGGSAQPVPQTSISGTLTVLSGIGTATYIVTPTTGACIGSTFTITVTVSSTCVPVSIGTQPTDNSMCSTFGTVSFTVSALGTSPFTCQWQYNNGGTWIDVTNGIPSGAVYTNATTTTLDVSGITTAINHQYRCYITNCSGSTNAASNPANLMVNPILSVPTIGTITQPTCSVATGSVILNGLPATGNWTLTRTPGSVITNGTGTTYTVTGLFTGTYTYTINNALGCGSIASTNIVINAQPATPTAPNVVTITQPTCTVSIGTVVLSGLPAGNWTLNPGAIVGSTPTTSLTLASGSYSYTVTNAVGCTSTTSSSIVINAQPVTPTAPALGTLLQPTCSVGTGSIVLMGLPVGNWTINPGSIAGATASTTLNGLTTGTHNYTITNSAGCTSAPSANVVINAQPATPSAPIVGTITQPTCAVGTGSVILSGLPSGNWAINPGSLLGSTSSVTISNLSPGTHTFTVENAAGCTSSATINIVINAQPATPTALTVSTITQPTCAVATGNVVLGSLPLGTWTINPGAIGGSTTTATISGLAAGTYTYTVTNSVGCISVASANVVINPQPATPAAPTIGTITQPTCTISTGSVILTGLPTGIWTLNPGIILGNTTSKTITSLNAGTYAYSVTNAAGCTSAVSSNIVINAQPVTPTVNLGINTTLCIGQTILLNAGNAGATYLWNPGLQTTQTKLVDGSFGVGPHTISVLVTSPNTCSATGSIIITFDACTGVAPTADAVSFSVNPNPSNGMFYLNVSGINETATMNIFNMSGQIIYTEKFDNADVVNKPIDLKSYPKGMYFIKLVTNNYSHIEKIIVE